MRPGLRFVLGPPGAGKTTLCQRLVDTVAHKRPGLGRTLTFSAGDLLRREAAAATTATARAEEIHTALKLGKLLPAELTVALLADALESLPTDVAHVLVDGFPRAIEQAELFHQLVAPAPAAVWWLDAPQDVVEQRLLRRSKHSGRSDDNADTIAKRFITYQQETLPMRQLYQTQGLVRPIDATGSRDAVLQRALELLQCDVATFS